MPNVKNISAVDSLVETLQNNPNVVLVGFEKTPHKKMEELRRLLGEDKKAKLAVIKNTLLEVALKKSKKEEMIDEKAFFGPSALLVLPEDWTSGLAAFYKFAKEDKSMTLKIGMIDGKTYMKVDLEKLAQLPSKEELVAKLIGVMKSPQRKLVYTLNFNMSRMVNVLKNAKKE
ncbi:MAG TPA: 50S ribosomal protein L10 [Candidatus Nitrosocosmicus sp.]|nr:50S ribosomal protein L10 [Candidatus Nitrosocosmicus sp.]